jgi:hypothetical protein
VATGIPVFKYDLGIIGAEQVKEKLQDLHKDYDEICMVAKEFSEYPF